MANAVHFAILGLASGGIYTMLALGVIVIYRASGAVNFADAAMAVGAGYVLFYLEAKNVPTPLALVLSVVAGLVFGLLVQLIVMRPLRSASALTKAIATLGILVVVQSGCQLKFGSDPQIVPAFLPQHGVTILGAHLTVDYIIIFGISILLTALLWWIYRATRLGLATAALSENEEALNTLGWSSSLIARGNWALAGALAALAGVLLAPLAGLSLPEMTTLLIPALAAALFGGLASFPLALLGAMFIGVVQSELAFYGNEPGIRSFPNLSDAVPFLVIIVILMARGKSLPARDYIGARLPRLGSGRLSPIPTLVSLVVAVLLIQVVLPIDWVTATTSCLIAAILLLSLVILTGQAGQLSLAQLSIAGLGALASARLVASHGWPLPIAGLVGIAVAIPIGLIIGLPAVRTRGVTLAVVTLGLAVALNALVFSSIRLTGGEAGINVGFPSAFGVEFDETTYPRRFSLVALIVFVLVALVVRNIRRSGAGRRFIAVRSNERAAASLGINIAGTKLHAFVLSSIVATIGGILIAFRYPNALFDNFDPFQSVNYVVESVIGGVGFIGGAIAGTGIEPSGVGNKVVSSIGLGQWLQFIGGLLLLLTVILNPDGIAGSLVKQLAPLTKRLRRRSGTVGVGLAPVDVDDLVRTEPTVLSVRGLTVKFGAVVAVDDVTLELHNGEVLGVIGPNGAGKTTLVDAITGYVASTGEITLDERSMQGLPAHKRSRAGITRSFQSLELFEELTVGENLIVASEHHGPSNDLTSLAWPGRTSFEPAALAVLQDFNFTECLDMTPADLTYGQRRLLGISRAVASHPRVLMLDEPAAGLDDHDRGELKVLLRRLAETWKLAVLLIEHDVELVMSVSDRVIAMEFGKVISEGAPDAVRRDPEVVRSYLGIEDIPPDATELPEGHAVPSGPTRAGPVRREGGNPVSDVLLDAAGIAAGYHGVPAITDVDLHVDAGEVVALLGANGAGKTTTIRALAGQLPLLAGTVTIGGTTKPGPLYRRVRNGLGLLTETRCLFMALTCRENLRLGQGSIDAALRYFPELEDRLDVRAGLVSGGQQQMLALARILAAKPKVLLADELSLGLAPIVVRRLLDALSDAARGGAAVLIVEQHARVALRAADRAYILRRGRIELSGPTADLRAREDEVTALYL